MPVTPERQDSAGLPWTGRELGSTSLENGTGENDFGGADPALQSALGHPRDEVALMRSLAAARLLVPVIAKPAEVEQANGGPVEKRTDMALITLKAPDGRRALPVFSGVDALAAWDPAARPVPVGAVRAAQAAVSERCEVMVVDVAGPRTVALRPSMVWALAQLQDWLPAHQDPFVARGIEQALSQEPAVLGHSLGAAREPGVLGVTLVLTPGLGPMQLQELTTRIGQRIATDGELRARIDGLAFTLTG